MLMEKKEHNHQIKSQNYKKVIRKTSSKNKEKNLSKII